MDSSKNNVCRGKGAKPPAAFQKLTAVATHISRGLISKFIFSQTQDKRLRWFILLSSVFESCEELMLLAQINVINAGVCIAEENEPDSQFAATKFLVDLIK